MQFTAMQLRQIASVCDALSNTELNDNVYKDNPYDATAINSKLIISTRNTGLKLGVIKMGSDSHYVFESV